jgi:hypothetical protein
MFICLRCGRFSKKLPDEKKDGKCSGCGSVLPKSVQEPNSGSLTDTDSGKSEGAPHPGFTGVLLFEASTGLGETELYKAPFVGKCLLRYAESLDIPGTAYNDILPTQPGVSRTIVQNKINEFKDLDPAKGQYPYTIVGKYKRYRGLSLQDDGHHTFVAALKARVPIMLYLVKAEMMGGVFPNWKECKYES